MKQTPGKIFLADQRGCTQTAMFQRYSTFNFGDYYQEHRKPFGSLSGLNEGTLAGSQSVTVKVDQATHLLLIPLTGAITSTVAQENAVTIEAGEIQLLTVSANSSIYLLNPYPTETISYLQIWLPASPAVAAVSSQVFCFELQDLENQLNEIIPTGNVAAPTRGLPFILHLGRFAGRQEVNYSLKKEYPLFFAFVITGAFEIEGRLLHEKDGLALWDTAEIELEALSYNSLILTLSLKEAVKA